MIPTLRCHHGFEADPSGDRPQQTTRLGILEYFDRLRYHENWPLSDLRAERPELAASRALARRLVSKERRSDVKALATAALRGRARRRASRLAADNPELRLHLGCGSSRLPGWVNVDLAGEGPDLPWDLRLALPFDDGTIMAIFHEHVLEHLPWSSAATLLAECHRLLKPGGILRIGVPDFGRFASDYAHGGHGLAEIKRERPTALLGLTELVFCYGHRSAWDEETLCALLGEIGFANASRRQFGDSQLTPVPDGSHRRQETLYVEALRPIAGANLSGAGATAPR